MKFAIQQRLGEVAEAVTAEDPWGMIRFELHGLDSRHFQKHQQRLGDHPAMRSVLNAMTKAGLRQTFLGVPEGEEQAAAFRGAVERAIEGLNLSAEEVSALMRADLANAVALVKSWSGPGVEPPGGGEPIPCTPENVRELLSDPSIVGPGLSRAGEALGDVLVETILEAAQAHARARREAIDEAGKGSGGASGGAAEPGPETTSPPSEG